MNLGLLTPPALVPQPRKESTNLSVGRGQPSPSLILIAWPLSYRLSGKEPTCQAAINPGSIHGSGRSPGEGNGNPLQYSCLENPRDRGACMIQSTGSQCLRHDLVTKQQQNPISVLGVRSGLSQKEYLGIWRTQVPHREMARGHSVQRWMWNR